MPELHGVVAALPGEAMRLKQLLLLFDKIYVVRPDSGSIGKDVQPEAEELHTALELRVALENYFADARIANVCDVELLDEETSPPARRCAYLLNCPDA